ncbi:MULTISPECIES: type II toxin-antitoxin system HicA family toxin [Pseudomonas]|uniref:Addiction module toxin, HicA family n=1 Tax=Pseudomonas putida NBRC 14164 TaxID=1211579 RepID=A0ABN5UG45_PSEPU|nr:MULTISPECIES: type II toxin-antitoxin system HicA family toxin [Pseudomonas]EKT4464489.1 type II toxin-antitoxin system HicA family toxin [Pseudomonas putida]EKT4558686.1 type II toxin-antitoxin system HicA family toxin [Pseudomonas putida]MCX9140179.1 type II toxin-antitoxin system HicA family toxin [Pseudomonas sp. DCB_PUT]MDD1974573.1 type II toxin-antitoxin system HicA family toxin [Pseudomonas putida]MDO1466583.1 type II toxin-antitoxin system HicA family toxin [Pseudomonas putida]
MRSREVIQLIEADGWYEVEVKGSHHQFRHPTKKGRVTVPHPETELPKGTVRSILKQAGLIQTGSVASTSVNGGNQ